MTQMPQSNQTSGMTGQDPQDEAPTFRRYVSSPEPAAHSRRMMIFMGLSIVTIIAGLIFWNGGPDEADAKPAKADVTKMTAEQLAENSSHAAAKELIRRMHHGTDTERDAAVRVVNGPVSPRLRRNLAMAMALQAQKRANAMHARSEREMRLAEQGY